VPCHLAILKRKYLDLIISGRKSMECRLTRIPCAPFRQAAAGEKVLFKQSAGPIRAQAYIEKALFFGRLTPDSIRGLRRRYNDKVCADADFWLSRLDCRYGSLIWLTDVTEIPPYRIRRKGLRAWIISEDDQFDL